MRIFLVSACLLLIGCRARDPAAERISVFAAASLTDVMEVLADSFEVRESGRYRVSLNLAGSSLLARQIAQGARADLFVSAHPNWTNYLVEEGRTRGAETLPVTTRLVRVSRHEAPAALEDGRLALADPDHVPAGIYAKRALECEGRWDRLSERIVPTLDVRAALAAVQEGASESAIVYASDALLAPELVTSEVFSERCQPSVRYTAAVILPESERGRRFLHLVMDPSMRAVWNRFGFTQPPEQ